MNHDLAVLILTIYLGGAMLMSFAFGWSTCRDVAASKAVREIKIIADQLEGVVGDQQLHCAFSETFVDLSEQREDS